MKMDSASTSIKTGFCCDSGLFYRNWDSWMIESRLAGTIWRNHN
jgi:hypothetical protein